MLDFERLQHFLVLSRELHFGRSADLLGMDQSMLSRSIQRLEENIGARLFERSRRRVALTPAGRTLVDEATRLLGSAERVARIVRQVDSGTFGDLRIGIQRPNTHGIAGRAIAQFRTRAPDVVVRLPNEGPRSFQERVKEDELDIALIRRPTGDRKGLQGLNCTLLATYALACVMPADWPLAAQTQVRFAELLELPLILFPREVGPDLYAGVLEAYHRAGQEPRIVQESWQTDVTLSLVAEGIGFAFIAAPNLGEHSGRVRRLPVADMPPELSMQLLAIRNPARRSWAADVFVEELQHAAEITAAGDPSATTPPRPTPKHQDRPTRELP